MDVTPPLKRHKDTQSPPPLNSVTDRRGYRFGLFPDAPGILRELKSRGVHIAAASRTTAPDLAREALANIYLEDGSGGGGKVVTAASYFQTMEIYPGSKMRHFRQIHARTKVDYEEMVRAQGILLRQWRLKTPLWQLFFDDERRNKEVEQLGVTMHFITSGLSRAAFDKGLAEWRRRRRGAQ